MMKRPGLFAIYAILKQMQFVTARYSDLAKSTPGVRNRGDYKSYLELLVEFAWIKREVRQIPSRSLRGALAHKWNTVSYYEITNKGKAFLELFPQAWDDRLGKKIIRRPGFLEVKKILEEISEMSKGGITSFSFLCVDEPAVVKNKRNCIRYLKLLRTLGWLQIKQQLYDLDFYDLTPKGHAFLQLFRKEQH
jgi:predicted transcriptional regulator